MTTIDQPAEASHAAGRADLADGGLIARLLWESGYLASDPAAMAADFADLGAPVHDGTRAIDAWLQSLHGPTRAEVVRRLAKMVRPDHDGEWRTAPWATLVPLPGAHDEVHARISVAMHAGGVDDGEAIDEVYSAMMNVPPLLVPEAALARLDVVIALVSQSTSPVQPARLVDDLLDLRSAIRGEIVLEAADDGIETT